MIKSNPLFHDSTVSQGSNIQTQFEVFNIEIQENQTFCLKLNVDGQLRFIEMSPRGHKTFHTSAWIEHRKRISYQFFIQDKNTEELIQASAERKALALHTIVEKWQSLDTDDWKADFKASPEFSGREIRFVEVEPPKKETTEDFLDGLIDKWDL